MPKPTFRDAIGETRWRSLMQSEHKEQFRNCVCLEVTIHEIFLASRFIDFSVEQLTLLLLKKSEVDFVKHPVKYDEHEEFYIE